MAIKSVNTERLLVNLLYEDVPNGQVQEVRYQREVLSYPSFAIGLCYELADLSNKDEKLFDKGVDYFLDFIMANFESELVIHSAKTVK